MNQGGEGPSPDQSPLGEDLFDLDQDADDGEYAVDRDAHDLRVLCALDWGAYEWQTTCEGDITGDGLVNVIDQLFVVNHWASAPTSCRPRGAPATSRRGHAAMVMWGAPIC